MKKNRLLIFILTLILGLFLTGCDFIDYINNLNNAPEIVDSIEEADDAEALAQLLAEKDLLEAEIAQLETDKTTLTNEVATLGIQKNNLETEIANLEGVVDSLEVSVESKNATITYLDNQISEKNNTIISLDDEIASKNALIASLQAQITEYEEDVLLVEDLTEEIAQLESDIAALEANKTSLQTDVTALESTKATLTTDIANLNQQKTILTNTINSLNSQKTTLQGDKATLETEIAALNQELLELEEQAEEYHLYLFNLFNEISLDIMKANIVVKTYKFSNCLGTGSGIIIKEDTTYYYLLTNNHVVYIENQTNLSYKAIDFRGNEYNASLQFRDPNHDLALLRITKDSELPVLRVITLETTNPLVQDRIIAIGQPLRQTNTVTFGKITTYTTMTLGDTPPSVSNVTYSVIMHDATILPGSSGGVLLNMSLVAVGINYAGSYDPETEEFTIGAAIPIEKVHLFLTENSFTL